MSSDPFTEAARRKAREVAVSWDPKSVIDVLVEMAEWARTHLAAQEPTQDEVEAAAEVWQAHSRLHHPIEGLEPSCEECGYAFGWPGLSASEEGRRYREHVARAALSAARAARRDEEKRDG